MTTNSTLKRTTFVGYQTNKLLSGAVVSKDVPDNTVVAAIPARIVKSVI